MAIGPLTAVVLGALFGSALAWLGLRSRQAGTHVRLSMIEKDLAAARSELVRQQEANAKLREQVAALESTLQHERKSSAEKLDLIDRATEELREAFQALASDALKSNNQSFLQLAKTSLEKFQSEAKGDLEARQKAVETLVGPIKESLNKVDNQILQIEKDRSQAYGALTEQVQSLIGTQKALQAETGNLVKALRTPSVRGRWGEIQLKRVVEIAGMEAYCDFDEQVTVSTSDGRLRPDLVVKLPGGKNVVVDAKTPLQAYLEAVEATDDQIRRDKLIDHARQVREHMRALASKAYWEQFSSNPEFVVMFLPGENCTTACAACRSTWTTCAKVSIARWSPTTRRRVPWKAASWSPPASSPNWARPSPRKFPNSTRSKPPPAPCRSIGARKRRKNSRSPRALNRMLILNPSPVVSSRRTFTGL